MTRAVTTAPPRHPVVAGARRWSRHLARQLDRRQPTATPTMMNRSTAALFVLCSLYGGAAAALRHELPHRGTVAALLVVCLATGLLLPLLRDRLRTVHYHLLLTAGVLVIGTCAHLDLAGGAAAGLSDVTLLMLLAVEAFFFFPPAVASGHLVVVVVTALLALGGGVRPADLLLLLCTWVLVGVLTAVLSRATLAIEEDVLTGVPNRRGGQRAVEELLASRVRAAGERWSLAVVDLDHFKAVNDTLGHAAGDELLRTTAAAWRGLLPRGGVLARWGGDEFLVLAPGGPPAATALLASMRTAMPPGRSCTAGVVGVTAGADLDLLLARADEALYRAKAAGRGRTASWGEDASGAGPAQPWLESQPSMRSDSGSSGSSAPDSSGASSRSIPTAAI